MATADHPNAVAVNPVLLTVAELARLLQVSTRTIWRLLSAGNLPAPVRLGNAVRWRSAEINSWISEGCPNCISPENEGRRK